MQLIIADIGSYEAATPEATELGELGRRPDVEAAVCEHVLKVLEGQTPGLLSCLATRWKAGQRRVAEHLRGSRRGRRRWDPKTVACAVEVLLVLSRERQGMDPLVGMSLARTALEWSTKGKLDSYQATGWTLYGNSARLRRMPKTCENALNEASRFLHGSIDEGLYARGLGLLRHEQGRGIEAVALLDHAGRCFEEVGFDGEAACCQALRCLLELDYGRRPYGDLSKEFPLALIRMDERLRQVCTQRPGQPGRGCWPLAIGGRTPPLCSRAGVRRACQGLSWPGRRCIWGAPGGLLASSRKPKISSLGLARLTGLADVAMRRQWPLGRSGWSMPGVRRGAIWTRWLRVSP